MRLSELEETSGLAREELHFLGKQVGWILYHQLDPNMIIFSWKFLFVTKRLKDFHWVLEKIIGPDPFK